MIVLGFNFIIFLQSSDPIEPPAPLTRIIESLIPSSNKSSQYGTVSLLKDHLLILGLENLS